MLLSECSTRYYTFINGYHILLNIHVANGIKPIKEFINKITWVLSWKNPAATMLIFLVSSQKNV
jgi:hypothetical protein